MLVNAAFREQRRRAAYDAWERLLARLPGSSPCHVAEGKAQFDLHARLGAIRAPTLFIGGEHDHLFGPEEARTMASAVTGSAGVVIPGEGHLSSLDSADRLNRLLLDFLAARSRRAAPM
jgi:pimeloyl-ACP methyl ester carboxylesterase